MCDMDYVVDEVNLSELARDMSARQIADYLKERGVQEVIVVRSHLYGNAAIKVGDTLSHIAHLKGEVPSET
jgi:hypothetical protein